MSTKGNSKSKPTSILAKGQLTLGQTQIATLLFLLLVPTGVILAQNVTELVDNATLLNLTPIDNITIPEGGFGVTPPDLNFSEPNTSTDTTTTTILNPPTTTLPDTTTTTIPESTTTTLPETTTTTIPESTTTTLPETTTTTIPESTTTTLQSLTLNPTLDIISPEKLIRGEEFTFEAHYTGIQNVDFYWLAPEGFTLVSSQDSCSSGSCTSIARIKIDSSAQIGDAKVRVEVYAQQ